MTTKKLIFQIEVEIPEGKIKETMVSLRNGGEAERLLKAMIPDVELNLGKIIWPVMTISDFEKEGMI